MAEIIEMTQFGKEISKRLIDLGKNQTWLIEEVKKKTGLFFDGSYLFKIKTGRISTPKIINAIREILNIKEG